MIYTDSSQPVERRVEDLLRRMTVEEKSNQLSSVWSYELIEQSRFSQQKVFFRADTK